MLNNVGFDYETGEPYSADFGCATSNRKDGVVYIYGKKLMEFSTY